ncbi:MAG: hypothetical protein K2X81_23070, partial [Candidatus Obscuribacterales bacterium]|nr:hypothetical protein [Candidatus Obscuribacterales bacterium]
MAANGQDKVPQNTTADAGDSTNKSKAGPEAAPDFKIDLGNKNAKDDVLAVINSEKIQASDVKPTTPAGKILYGVSLDGVTDNDPKKAKDGKDVTPGQPEADIQHSLANLFQPFRNH